jgi:hypothetical protein
MIKARGLFRAIMYKKPKGKEMNPALTAWNRIISQTRYMVERTFGGLSPAPGLRPDAVCGASKDPVFFRLGAISYNLIRCLKLPIIQPE